MTHRFPGYRKSEALQFPSAGVELVAIAPNLVHAGRSGRRAAVKQRQRMPLLLECGHSEPPDEAIPANEKDAHGTVK